MGVIMVGPAARPVAAVSRERRALLVLARIGPIAVAQGVPQADGTTKWVLIPFAVIVRPGVRLEVHRGSSRLLVAESGAGGWHVRRFGRGSWDRELLDGLPA